MSPSHFRITVGTTASAIVLAALSAGCSTAARSSWTMPEAAAAPAAPQQAPRPATIITESVPDLARRICRTWGFGMYETPRVRIECVDPHGIRIIEQGPNTLNLDMPEPQRLKEKDLAAYIKGKKVVLFGDEHSNSRKYADIFIRALDHLQMDGFTHVGIEYDHASFQGYIDAFMRDGDEEKLARGFNVYGDMMMAVVVRITRAARGKHMKVVCIDDSDPRLGTNINWDQREERMFNKRVNPILKGNTNRMAVFIGEAHITSEGTTIVPQGLGKDGGQRYVIVRRPLGYRLARAYGRQSVGLVGLGGCAKTSRYVFACVDAG